MLKRLKERGLPQDWAKEARDGTELLGAWKQRKVSSVMANVELRSLPLCATNIN